MRKNVSIIIMLVLFMIYIKTSETVYADTICTYESEVSYEYFSDGSFFETKIIYNSNRSTIKGASKTTTYKNSVGTALWYVTVTGNFTYNGSSSSCTASSASAGSYSNAWKILNKSASKSGSSATAIATAGQYIGNVAIGSYNKSVTLRCDANGNLS